VCDGRLSNKSTDYLLSNIATYSGEQHAEAKVYYHRHCGDSIALYDGTNWNLHTIPATPIELSTTGFYDAGVGLPTPYDIFIYSNAGTLTLEGTKWASRTARTTALVRQNGILVKSGATTRRYLGTVAIWSDDKIYMRKRPIVSSGLSEALCLVRNAYNQIIEPYYNGYLVSSVTSAITDGVWRSVPSATVGYINGVFGASYDDPLCHTAKFDVQSRLDILSMGTSTYFTFQVALWNVISGAYASGSAAAVQVQRFAGDVACIATCGICPTVSGYNSYSPGYSVTTDGSGTSQLQYLNTFVQLQIPW
jgi:hypothetical protein